MLFSYKAVDRKGETRDGTVDAVNVESAIETIESRGYSVVSVNEIAGSQSIFDVEITWFQRVSNKEIDTF